MNSIFLKRAVILTLIVFATVVVGYASADLDFSSSPQHKIKQSANVSLAMAADVNPNKLYEVTDIVDGDTFRVKMDGTDITIRMLGINTPETVDPRKQPECYGPEASAEMRSLLNGREVRLALNPDREKTDSYGRLLAFVYRDDGIFINELLVQEGFAREYTVGKTYEYQSEFRNVERQAKTAKRGLWGKCNV